MNEQQKRELILESWNMQASVEAAYLNRKESQGDEGWQDKQRLLMADMALHLLQTALTPTELDKDKLTNNLNAILTIADEFLPHAELKKQPISSMRYDLFNTIWHSNFRSGI